jgi:ribonucleoside-diphosphate reductase alpha chain
MGVKAIAIYRDNCKVAQPLSGKKNSAGTVEDTQITDNVIVPKRKELPRKRQSETTKFRIGELKGYFTVTKFEDGTPGELFMSVSKQGSTLAGLMDSFAISISNGLQYGVPLKDCIRSLMGTTFAPSGITDDPEIRTTTSITDYVMRRLAMDYLSFEDRLELGLATMGETAAPSEAVETVSTEAKPNKTTEAPLCFNCGNQTQKAGSCYVCSSCGSTTGCS